MLNWHLVEHFTIHTIHLNCSTVVIILLDDRFGLLLAHLQEYKNVVFYFTKEKKTTDFIYKQ